MPFKKILNELVQAMPEAIGAIIVDYDGECVQLTTKSDEHDVKVVGAYQKIQLDLLKNIFDHKTNAFITKSDGIDIVSMPIDDEYLVSLILKGDSLIGQAEYVLKSRLKELKEIM